MFYFSGAILSAFIAMSKLFLYGTLSQRNFNLHNIILNPVNDRFIDSHFIGKSMRSQAVFFGKGKNLFISLGNGIPVPFVEGS